MEKPRTEERLQMSTNFTTAIIFLVVCIVTIVVSVAYLSFNSGQTIPRFVSIILVLFCYGFVGYLMLVYFSYRILSPFERYKTDMKNISSGKYSKRLNLRDNDETNVKSFFGEVNSLLSNMENMHKHNSTLYNHINDWIVDLNKVMSTGSSSHDDIKKSVASLENRLKEISSEFKQP
jgi:signal transduction histidine kinase